MRVYSRNRSATVIADAQSIRAAIQVTSDAVHGPRITVDRLTPFPLQLEGPQVFSVGSIKTRLFYFGHGTTPIQKGMMDNSTQQGVHSFSVAATNGPNRLSAETPAPKDLRKIPVASVCCVVYTGD